jgi:CPA1 family monovalent cation:H+ antiporter
MSEVEIVLALLVAVVALAALAGRLRVPYPILLVLGGVVLGFVPALPPIQLDPATVFLIFVPPLVFAAAFFTSWRDFTADARPILLLAVGLVLATTFVVAGMAHLAGMAWGPAFVLGAVVSNTDTTAVVAIAQQVGLPRRIMTILEGESLVNDAVALTAFRIAVIGTVSGAFSPWNVGGQFALAVLGAVPIGLGVGWLTAAARARAHDARIVTIIGLLTPYAAFLPADQIGASGILAVVIAGLFVGRRETVIEDAATRLQARAVWDVFVFVLNGLLFILVGAQLRPIWDDLQTYPLGQVAAAAIVVSLTVIAIRILWVALVGVVPRWVGRRDLSPVSGNDWRKLAVVVWAGLRGADTLAAALSVPLVVASGAPFPARAEILFLAFAVIVVTLVGLGLSLPPLIRRLGVASDDVEEREEATARRAAAEAALERLAAMEREEGVPPELVVALRKRYAHEAASLPAEDGQQRIAADHVAVHNRLRREVLGAERAAVLRLRDEGVINDDVLRRVQRDIDLEEAHFEP